MRQAATGSVQLLQPRGLGMRLRSGALEVGVLTRSACGLSRGVSL